MKLMDSMPRLRSVPPALGQDNEDVYENVFGVSPKRLQELKEQGVI